MCCLLVLFYVLFGLGLVQSYSGSAAQSTDTCVLQPTFKMAKFSGDQATKLAESFGAVGLTPAMKTPEQIQTWMMGYLESVGKLPVQEEHQHQPDPVVKKEETTGKGVYQPPPRLSTFSGDPTAKGDAQFDLWKYEVDCLLREAVHSEETVKQAMRKALKGNAARIVMRKGTDATCQQILSSLETVYGLVETGENLLAEFYAARQDKTEDVASWSCKIEDLLERATERGHVAERDKADMLKTKFWTGLRQNLKDGSRHKYDTDLSFDELRVVVRRLEREYDSRDSQDRDGKTAGKAQAKMAVTSDESQQGGADAFTELKGMVHKLSNQVSAMQKQMNASKPGASGKSASGFQKKGGNYTEADSDKTGQAAKTQGTSGSSAKKRQDIKCYRCEGMGHIQRDCPTKRTPVCWDCGEEGHTKWNCPAKSLNEETPLSKGGQRQ